MQQTCRQQAMHANASRYRLVENKCFGRCQQTYYFQTTLIFREKPRYVLPLKSYTIPTNLRDHMNIGQLRAVFESFEDGGSYTAASYCRKFSKLLHVEELQMEVDIAKYQMDKAKLKKPKAKQTRAS